MLLNFFSLAREIRDEIYELVLVHEDRIDHLLRTQKKINVELLRVNKAIHREASSLFYNENCFDFTNCTSEDVTSFLGQIGSKNANLIRNIYLSFPKFLFLETGAVTLEADSIGVLKNLRCECASLSTLKTCVHSGHAFHMLILFICNPESFTEALKLVDTHFRVIPSLQEIIIEMYGSGPNDDVLSPLKSHGWTIRLLENLEDEDFNMSLCDETSSEFKFNPETFGHDSDDANDSDNLLYCDL